MSAILEQHVPGFEDMTPAQIVEALNAPQFLQKMTLTDFFAAVVGAGADVAEMRGLWQFGRYVDRVSSALFDGDLAGLMALIATCPVEFSPEALTAINTVAGANARSLWQMYVDPATVATVEGVAEILGVRGWTWDGTAWTYTEPEEGGIV